MSRHRKNKKNTHPTKHSANVSAHSTLPNPPQVSRHLTCLSLSQKPDSDPVWTTTTSTWPGINPNPQLKRHFPQPTLNRREEQCCPLVVTVTWAASGDGTVGVGEEVRVCAWCFAVAMNGGSKHSAQSCFAAQVVTSQRLQVRRLSLSLPPPSSPPPHFVLLSILAISHCKPQVSTVSHFRFPK